MSKIDELRKRLRNDSSAGSYRSLAELKAEQEVIGEGPVRWATPEEIERINALLSKKEISPLIINQKGIDR